MSRRGAARLWPAPIAGRALAAAAGGQATARADRVVSAAVLQANSNSKLALALAFEFEFEFGLSLARARGEVRGRGPRPRGGGRGRGGLARGGFNILLGGLLAPPTSQL